MKNKFSPTKMEKLRKEFEVPPEGDERDRLRREPFEDAVKLMKNSRTVDMDEKPTEV